MASLPSIRLARESELAEIVAIALAAWIPIMEYLQTVMDAEMFRDLRGDWREVKAGQITDHFRAHPDQVVVVEIDGALVGFATFAVEPGRYLGTILNNAVSPAGQGRGVGQATYRWILDEFRRRGLKYADVFTGLDHAHAPARRAYAKVGFNREWPQVRYFMTL